MAKYYKGDVIRVYSNDGIGGLKERHVIVLKDTKRSDTAITVYCTGQNNGDDKNNIKVLLDSEIGQKMGLTKDTYIRPKTILNIDFVFIDRLVGKCPLMNEIQKIMDDNMAL